MAKKKYFLTYLLTYLTGKGVFQGIANSLFKFTHKQTALRLLQFSECYIPESTILKFQ